MSQSPSNYRYSEPVEKEFVCLPKGEYPFRVIAIYDEESSRNGNPMIPIDIEVGDRETGTAKLKDWLVFTEATEWRVNSFLKSLCPGGIASAIDFTSGDFKKWLMTREGRCTVKVEMATAKQSGKQYERNDLDRYVYESSKTAKASAPPAAEEKEAAEDDAPF